MDENLNLENIITNDNINNFNFIYPIIDQSNKEITNPDLTTGYLKKEYFTLHHEAIPEKWHYEVKSFDFADGERYNVESQDDPHILYIDTKKGIFTYQSLEGEPERIVTGQTTAVMVDQSSVKAYDEQKVLYRYIPYTEKELADRNFLTNGPTALIEAQETIDELLLVIADLLGGIEE